MLNWVVFIISNLYIHTKFEHKLFIVTISPQAIMLIWCLHLKLISYYYTIMKIQALL